MILIAISDSDELYAQPVSAIMNPPLKSEPKQVNSPKHQQPIAKPQSRQQQQQQKRQAPMLLRLRAATTAATVTSSEEEST